VVGFANSRGILDGDDGDDVLTGGSRDDNLIGWGGNDRINAGAGRDWIRAGRGRDVIHGGPGRDRIKSRDGERDTVMCGAGPRPRQGRPARSPARLRAGQPKRDKAPAVLLSMSCGSLEAARPRD
jgi:hypothetical protein